MTLRVSIITVTYNDRERFEKTCHSLQKQYGSIEIEHVVVDGGSSDGTIEWYAENRAGQRQVIISEPDQGIFDAMNKGTVAASGHYVAFMNAGDSYANPQAIEKSALRLHERGKRWGYCRAKVVSATGDDVRPAVGRIPYSRSRHLYGTATICHQAVLMERSFLGELGRFEHERYGTASDYALLLRAATLEVPDTVVDTDVLYEAGGISKVDIYRQLWRRHRARIDLLGPYSPVRPLDSIWTSAQIARVLAARILKVGLKTLGVRSAFGRHF